MPFSKFTKEFRHQTIFFCSTYFYTYCIIRWWYIHVLSHSFHFKFLHISNCFEVMLDGFITSFRIQFSKILDMNHSKLWWTFFHMKRNNAFRRNKIAKDPTSIRLGGRETRSSDGISETDDCNFRRSKWFCPWFRPQFDLLWLFFYRLAYNSNFLSRGSLEESQKRSRIDLPLHMDLHLLSQNTKICAVLSTTRINKLKHHLGPILRSKRK